MTTKIIKKDNNALLNNFTILNQILSNIQEIIEKYDSLELNTALIKVYDGLKDFSETMEELSDGNH